MELLPREGFSMELPDPALSLHVAEARASLLVALCASQLLLIELGAADGSAMGHPTTLRTIALDAPTAAPAEADDDDDDDDG